MKRWGNDLYSHDLDNEGNNIGLRGICSKSLRKTYENWLIYYYFSSTPYIIYKVFLSQGYNRVTSLRHYLCLPFDNNDRKEMEKWVGGWDK